MGEKRGTRDILFYATAVLILAAVGTTWYVARRMIRHAEGRDVQALLAKENLATVGHYEKQAKNYVAEQARKRPMTADQRREAEKIFARAFHQRMETWIQSRTAAESPAAQNAKLQESWQRHSAEFEALMKSAP